MKLLVCFCVQIFFVTFFVTLCCADSGEKGPKRSRLLSNVGLIPFPRIGRGGDLAWGLEPAYPKIGRTWMNDAPVLENAVGKRNGPKTVSTGLWFGPRLGRLQKRGGYVDEPWTYVLLGGAKREHRTGQTIIPFMRTGRRRFMMRTSDSGENIKPKPGHIMQPMMRTGRGGDLSHQNEESDVPGYRQAKYTPRLGRESEEVEDYNEENPMQTTENVV